MSGNGAKSVDELLQDQWEHEMRERIASLKKERDAMTSHIDEAEKRLEEWVELGKKIAKAKAEAGE